MEKSEPNALPAECIYDKPASKGVEKCLLDNDAWLFEQINIVTYIFSSFGST